jgi:hypothetical protein
MFGILLVTVHCITLLVQVMIASAIVCWLLEQQWMQLQEQDRRLLFIELPQLVLIP